MSDKIKIKSPKEVIEEGRKHKTLKIDSSGDIVDKLNKEYEDLYGKRNNKINKENIFLDISTGIFILIAFLLILLF